MRTVFLEGNTKAGALGQLPETGSLPLDKRAEIAFIGDLIENCWSQLASYLRMEYSKQGFDIEIIGTNTKMAIELKASSYKADYFNQNGSRDYLYGNCLKAKDISLTTGLLKADFLVFAAEMQSSFDFWLFTRDDLATLLPRSPTFIPSFIPTLMIDAPSHGANFGSHFNDDFNLFKKGAMCIILPIYDRSAGQWTSSYPTGTYHTFLDTWCPLIDMEYGELEKVVTTKMPSRFNRNLVFTYTNRATSNPNFKTRQCNYRISTTNAECLRCKEIIGGLTPL
jgi:hypothetical protein